MKNSIEKKYSERWQKEGIHKTKDLDNIKNKYYCLDMFPYPSGSGLHVGHAEGYIASDILSRFKRMKGYDLIHPMGWDAFGLPAENYAIKTGKHPSFTTEEAIKNYRKQMDLIGLSYDWNLEINTSKSDYYKWTQWFFLLLYKKGLAYKKKARVNWCEKCATVLANEQVKDGTCERCGQEVVQKDLAQWFFKITDFIEDQEYQGKKIKGLLSGLKELDWPESTKLSQINWIGKSSGASINFKIENHSLNVFTTRPDTLFGCNYIALSPEHSLIKELKSKIKNWSEVSKYIKESNKKTEMERDMLNKAKSGVEIKGIKAINPANKEKIPVFIADYVLSSYGSGAIMAVPAHDQRDYEFAKKYKINITQVIRGGDLSKEAYTGEGEMVNSNFLNKLKSSEAKEKMMKYLEEKNLGERSINYRLRDWLVSRQRYWGAPIPIIYCDKCGEVPVPEKDLPVELPMDVDFMPSGESPLIYSKKFHEVNCPKCGLPAKRESDTMDTFVCSSWYYFRYLDSKNEKEFANKDKIEKLLPVDIYIGGAEHSVMHLLYSRFLTKVLEKYDYINFNEPFKKLRHPGTILAEDNTKMSKSKGNVVNPDDIIKEYGADTLRIYEMFMGPLEDSKPWNTKNILGSKRFLDKAKNLFSKVSDQELEEKNYEELNTEINKTIKKVGEDIENLKFNTAISQLMVLVNTFSKFDKIPKKYFQQLLLILAPFAPFLSEDLWLKSGEEFSIHQESWPNYDENLLKKEKINLAVQINGKTRGNLEIEPNLKEEEVKEKIKLDEKLAKYLESGIKKVIYIPNRIINIITK
jgi:leucyl-tRNA synthetase